MDKKIFATITASILILTTAPIDAQTYKSSSYFYSDFFKDKPSDCKTFYPAPIGAVPGLKAPDYEAYRGEDTRGDTRLLGSEADLAPRPHDQC